MKKANRKSAPASANRLRIRFRVLCGDDIALGPGKVQLLQLIRDTGSIRHAAEEMEMSYMRAWTLIKTMNQCFRKPLVEMRRGGSTHGGASLTATGEAVLQLYAEIEQSSLAATTAARRKLLSLLPP